MGALVESEPLSEGPPRRGSRYRDVFEDHGQRIELEALNRSLVAPLHGLASGTQIGFDPGALAQVPAPSR